MKKFSSNLQSRLTTQHILIIIACTLLVVALIYQHSARKEETSAFIKELEPSASRYEQIAGGYPTYKLWDEADQSLGYAVEAEASGYGGPLRVLTFVEIDGTLKKTIIIDNCETPAYLQRVLKESYLEGFIGKNVSDPFEPGLDLDTISGATYTTKGIALAIQKGAVHVGSTELGLQVSSESRLQLGWQELGLILLYSLTFIGITRQYTKLRPWVLGASVLFLGFLLNSALSLANLTSLISGNIPSFLERPFWHLLTLGILIPTLVWGRNFYCSWLCPFGGVQEGIYKVLGFKKFNISPRVTALIQKIRWFVLWGAVITALLLNNPSLASYEPFAVSFGGAGNLLQWLTLFLVLLSSVLIHRVWCHFACPVGAVLNLVATIKRKMKLHLFKDSY